MREPRIKMMHFLLSFFEHQYLAYYNRLTTEVLIHVANIMI